LENNFWIFLLNALSNFSNKIVERIYPMNRTNRMMKSALLFYKKLLSGLKEMGFKVNPYDPCVANKLVGGANMTIQWHVDDPMI
jgi:hypothetical protein